MPNDSVPFDPTHRRRKAQNVVGAADDEPAVIVAPSPPLPMLHPHPNANDLPVVDFRSAALLFLQHLWTEAHEVLFVTLRLMVEERKRIGGGAVPPAVGAMRRHLDAASKYAVLGAIHLARCRCIRSDRLKAYGLAPVVPAVSAMAAAAAGQAAAVAPQPPSSSVATRRHQSAAAAGNVASMVGAASTFLISFFQGKSGGGGGASAVPPPEDEELLNAALRILPGCYCVEADEAPFVALLFPSLLVPMDDDDGTEGICLCRHEWSRGVLPMLAVAMVVEQFAVMRSERWRRLSCWRRWKAAARHRRTASWVGSTAKCTMPLDAVDACTPAAAYGASVMVEGNCSAEAAADGEANDPFLGPSPLQQQHPSELPPLHPPAATAAPQQRNNHSYGAPQQDELHSAPPPWKMNTTATPLDDAAQPPEPLARHPSATPQWLQLNPAAVLPVAAQRSQQVGPQQRWVVDVCLAKAFAGWKGVVLDPYIRERCRTQQRLITASVHALRRRRTHLAMHRASRMKLQRAAFESWRDVYVPHSKALRWWAWQQARTCRQRVWGHWRSALRVRETARRDAEAAIKLDLLLDVKAAETTHRLLERWFRATQVQQFQRGTVVTRCFTKWRSLHAFSLRCNHLLLSAAQVQLRRCAVAAMRTWTWAWHQRVAQRCYTRKLVHRWWCRADKRGHEVAAEHHLVEARKTRCMRKLLRQWHDVWGRQLPRYREETCIVVQWQQARLLAVWKRRCATRRHHRLLLQDAVACKQRAVVERLWEQWKQRARLHACAGTLRRVSRLVRLRTALERWHRRKWLLDSLRDEAEHRAAIFSSIRQLRSCLGAWRRHWVHRLVCYQDRQDAAEHRLAEQTHRFASLRRCFQQWVGAWAALRRLHRVGGERLAVASSISNDGSVVPPHAPSSAVLRRSSSPYVRPNYEGDDGQRRGWNTSSTQIGRVVNTPHAASPSVVYVHRPSSGGPLQIASSQAPPLTLARTHLLASVAGRSGSSLFGAHGPPSSSWLRDRSRFDEDDDDEGVRRSPTVAGHKPPASSFSSSITADSHRQRCGWRDGGPLRDHCDHHLSRSHWDGALPSQHETAAWQPQERHDQQRFICEDDSGDDHGPMFASVEIVMACDDASWDGSV